MKINKKSLYLVTSINKFLLETKLLYPNQSFVLTVSGGQDSISLLFILFILKKQWNIRFYILHCNHLWYKNSIYTYFHFSKIIICLQIPLFYCLTLKKLKTEEEARYWRSKIYCRLGKFLSSQKVLTGHTQTDQIETFFFNLLRGTSFLGSSPLRETKTYYISKEIAFLIPQNKLISLFEFKKIIFFYPNLHKKKRKKSVTQKNDFFPTKKFLLINKNLLGIEVIRPLLTKTRIDTQLICTKYKFPLFPDPSNEKLIYSRNRLRKQVLPIFRFFFNPQVDVAIAKYIRFIYKEENYNELLISKLFDNVIAEDKNGYFFNISIFYCFSNSIQKKLCVLFFKEKLQIQYSFQNIEYFIDFINTLFLFLKKEKKKNVKNTQTIPIFFPELGTIYFSQNFILFIK